MTLSNFVGTQWFFSSQAKNHIFSAFNNVGKFLLFIFSVFLLEDNDNFYMFLYVGAFVNCLVMYFCYIWTFNKSKIKFFKVKIREGYLNLLKNRDVFLADFSPQIYITVPLLISKQFWDHYSYSSLVVALRFYNAGMVVQWSMLRAVLPIQKKYSELLFAKAVKASAFVCFSQYLSIVLLAYPVLDFMFDYPIHDIYRNTVIISFSYFASHYYITYGYHYRVLNGTTDVLKKDSMKVSFFSVFITPVAIYYFGVFGYMFCFVFLKSLYGFICFKRFKTEREGD